MEAMGREEENSYVVRKLEASSFNTHLSGPRSQLCVFISTVSAALPSGGTITVPKGPPYEAASSFCGPYHLYHSSEAIAACRAE